MCQICRVANIIDSEKFSKIYCDLYSIPKSLEIAKLLHISSTVILSFV